MHDRGVTEEEFQAARTAYIDGLVPASYETAHLLATRLATKALFGFYDYQSPQYLNYYAGDAAQLAALKALTREDVNRAARKYLHPANLVIAVAGPLQVIQARLDQIDEIKPGELRSRIAERPQDRARRGKTAAGSACIKYIQRHASRPSQKDAVETPADAARK